MHTEYDINSLLLLCYDSYIYSYVKTYPLPDCNNIPIISHNIPCYPIISYVIQQLCEDLSATLKLMIYPMLSYNISCYPIISHVIL